MSERLTAIIERLETTSSDPLWLTNELLELQKEIGQSVNPNDLRLALAALMMVGLVFRARPADDTISKLTNSAYLLADSLIAKKAVPATAPEPTADSENPPT